MFGVRVSFKNHSRLYFEYASVTLWNIQQHWAWRTFLSIIIIIIVNQTKYHFPKEKQTNIEKSCWTDTVDQIFEPIELMIEIFELQSTERRCTKFYTSFKIIGLNFSIGNWYLSPSVCLFRRRGGGGESFMDFSVIYARLDNINDNNNKDH